MDSNNYNVYLFDYSLGEVRGLELLREVEDNGCRDIFTADLCRLMRLQNS